MSRNTITTYYVKGMHCAACEVLVEKNIGKLRGVSSAVASLGNRSVTIEHDSKHKPNISKLNSIFETLGYSFSDHTSHQTSLPHSLFTAGVAIMILFIIFLVLKDLSILPNISVSNTSSLSAFFLLGVIASVSTCAALVGGIMLAMSTQWKNLYATEGSSIPLPYTLFHLGRIISFIIFGALLGLLGSKLKISVTITSYFVIIVSVFMVILGLQILGIIKKATKITPRWITKYISDENNFKGKYAPLLLGALTFFVPCGFTLMAQTAALGVGSPMTSMLIMTAFVLGTTPALVLINFGSLKLQNNASTVRVFNILAGVFVVIFGLYTINSQLNVLGAPSLSDISSGTSEDKNTNTSSDLGVKQITENGKEYQQVTIKAQGFNYIPRAIKLKVGIPVKFNVINDGVIGCAQAMYLPGLYDDVLYLRDNLTKAEFTPQKTGTFKISCTMGMVPPVSVIVEE